MAAEEEEGGMMDDSGMGLLGEQSSLRLSGNQPSNNLLSSNNMESAQLSNGALLNVAFGSNNMSRLDSDAQYESRMQSMDSNIQGLLNQTAQLREELETRAFLNQPMQYHQAELDSAGGPQDYSDFGQSSNSRDQDLLRSLRANRDQDLLSSLRNSDQGLLSNLRNHASRQHAAEGNDDLVNMINSSLKDHF